MKRLLVITNIYPPQNLGGFGICIERLTKGLIETGHVAKVITSNEEYLGPDTKGGYTYRKLKLLGNLVMSGLWMVGKT